MKLLPLLLAALVCAFAPVASAQGLSSHYDAGLASEPDTQALGFIRIPLADRGQKSHEPKIGFGLFQDCSRLSSRLSPSHTSACESQPVRSLEFTRDFYARDWLISFSGNNRWVGIGRWHPNFGLAHVDESGPVLSGPILQGPEY